MSKNVSKCKILKTIGFILINKIKEIREKITDDHPFPLGYSGS